VDSPRARLREAPWAKTEEGETRAGGVGVRILSFGWTWPAVVARRKTVTRREWNERYARSFHKGEELFAFDRSPRFRGRPIAKIRLTADPVLEADALATDEDYEGEGFAYLAEHRELLPKAAHKQPWGACTREAFEAWRQSGETFWVVRFEVVEVLDERGVVKHVEEETECQLTE
jgi:hypothetical protein